MKNLLTKSYLRGACALVLMMPLVVLADSAPTCAGQAYTDVLATCLQPGSGDAGIQACTNIIKYNCLSANPQASALQINTIHAALASQYANKAMQSVSSQNTVSTAALHTTPQTASHASGVSALQRSTDSMLVNSVHATNLPRPVAPAQPAVKKEQKTNYWF